MRNPWQTATPIERQAAAAEMWMEMTGRTKVAQAKVFDEGLEVLEKVAAAAVIRQPPTAPAGEPPKLRTPTAIGAGAGAVGGGALALRGMHKGLESGKLLEKGVSKGRLLARAGVGGAAIGAGIGAAAGLAYGGHRLYRHIKKAAAPPNPQLVSRGSRWKTWHPQDQDDETLHALDKRMKWSRNTPSNKRWTPSKHEAKLLFPTGMATGGLAGFAATHSIPHAAALGLVTGAGMTMGAPLGRHAGQALAHRRVRKEIERRGEKRAFLQDPMLGPLGAFGGGTVAGYRAGKALAGPTANMAAPYGDKVKAQELAKKLAIPVSVVAAIGAMYVMHGGNAHKIRQWAMRKFHKLTLPQLDAIEHGLVPILSGLGGGAAGGVGTGLAVAGGFRAKNSLKKQASTRERVLGAAGGALALGGAGALASYLSHRRGADGTSKAQLQQQAELDNMRALFTHQSRDLKNLSGMKGMKHRYAEMKRQAVLDAKESPGHAAAVQSLPWALGGAGLGAYMGPRVLSVARRLRA